jgi:meso-butanediol dehydrogenase/(S,S)-butanediol dehydrogenase/diacetyl reductase
MAKKTALITGAAGGIGTALAKRLAARDYNLALVDVAEIRLRALVADLGLSNVSALTVAADVSKEADVNEYVRRTIEKFGAIDCFANNAAIEGPSTVIEETTVESFDRVYAINVRGVFLGLRAVLSQMRKRDRGSIVNTASLATRWGLPKLGAYIMSKHAVAGLTKVAAVEVAALGIRDNVAVTRAALSVVLYSLA